MLQLSADHSDSSRGSLFGYISYYDDLTLHKYMTHSPPRNDVIPLVDVLEKINNTGYVRN